MKVTKLLTLLSALFLLSGCKTPVPENADGGNSSSEASGNTTTYTVVTHGNDWYSVVGATMHFDTETNINKLKNYLDDSHGLISSISPTHVESIECGENKSDHSLYVGGKPSNEYTGVLTIETSHVLTKIDIELEAYWKTWSDGGGGSNYDTEIDFLLSGGASELSDNLHGQKTSKEISYDVNAQSVTLTVTGGRALVKQISFTYEN